MSISETFAEKLRDSLGFTPYPYQERVVTDVLNTLEKSRFVVVSMPTGSGKTLVELMLADHLRRKGMRVLVLEPTRLLCDQMYHNFWVKVFDSVGEEYEGNCASFEEGKELVVSTPFTSSKCMPRVDAVIVDEVHHAFGDPRYMSGLLSMRPKIVIGFTALLPSSKRYSMDSRFVETFGMPSLLAYDFRKLSEIDPSFTLPKAIADVFDAEMDGVENVAYDALLKGKVAGDERALSFLRFTLYSHGKMAFCESLENLRDKVSDNVALRTLCSTEGLGHKARSIKEILEAYDVEEHRPVLIFTARRSTAHEFEVLLHNMGITRVKTLTGELNKEERLQIVNEAKNGDVDVIISTHVGEEGIDIPEARLLIMTDVPKSPLRFYQRLGRLIRKSESKGVKYLVVTLTPKTPEYDDLDEALRSLHKEGVDVSYIVERKSGKGSTSRILDQVKAENGEVPLMRLLEMEYDLKNYMMVRGKSSVVQFLNAKEQDIPYSDFVDRAITDGDLLYYYDVEGMGNLFARILLSKYCQLCYGSQCQGLCDLETMELGRSKQYKLTRKDLLRYFMVIFTADKLRDVEKKMEIRFDNPGFGFSLQSNVNEKNNSINFVIQLNASINGITVYPKITLAYYGVKKEMKEFLKKNVMAICNVAGRIYFSYFTSLSAP
ncbi:ATP-dependent RNA helicase SrmB [Metallosphaera sp. J1]|uniref:DEAD/DEAH box helicase n=1 Tax=Metallosphaera javensis (ex Hofmann et al. 2022) TaxID=99938 RepID=UPI001EDE978F|nr:DEAD/DEAH box helicase [Metallosphaera javensis (ex Hofmann et al. 2022)]MCG3108311.1 ATP-dependent RNA helicase SrmB [Metallosphaera javensis (ex Hofmann et al. 2022)]